MSFTYKKGAVKPLIDQNFCLNNALDGVHLDLEKLKVILQKNEYPSKSIDKSVTKYLSKKVMNMPSEAEPRKTEENTRYFKLPFIRIFSKFTENKLHKLPNIKIVFRIFKLTSLFSTKDNFHVS